MRFSYLALLALAAGAVNAAEEVSFSGELATTTVGGKEVKLSLNDDSKCTIEYQTLPFVVDCNVAVDVSVDGEVKLTTGGKAGAKVSVKDESDLILELEYGVDVPKLDFSGGVPATEHYPKDGGYVMIDLPDEVNVKKCATDVMSAFGSEGALLKAAFENSGSELCVNINGIAKDGAAGASFSVLVDLDFLNEDLFKGSLGLITKETFVSLRDGLGLPEIDRTINIGQKIIENINSNSGAVTDRRLRRLSSSSGTAYVNGDGEFTLGSKSNSGPNMLLIGTLGGAGVLVLAVGGFIFFKRTQGARV